MTQTVHFQGNPVHVAGQLPQAGDKAKPFKLVAKIFPMLIWQVWLVNAKS